MGVEVDVGVVGVDVDMGVVIDDDAIIFNI